MAGNLIPFPASSLVGEGSGAQLQLLTAGQEIYQILTPEGTIQAYAPCCDNQSYHAIIKSYLFMGTRIIS